MRLIFHFPVLIFVFSCTDLKKAPEVKPDNQGTIEFNGIQFRYERHGHGDPLVVVGSSVYYSKAFSDNLKEKFEMIFVDGRHFIPSYNPTDEELASMSLTTWADDLEMLRKELKLDKVTVIGHSIHVQIALQYADKYPDNVRRLILVCGTPFSPTEYSDKVKELWTKDADENRKSILELRLSRRDSLLSVTPANRHFAVIYDINAPLYWIDPNYDASNLLNDLTTSPKAFGKLVTSVPVKQEVIDKLIKLKMPTLVIVGRLDFAIPHTAWEEILQNTPIEYQLMQDASHNPHTEAATAKQFDMILKEWMSK